MDAAWSGARAVVTGAAGFLGGHLVEHLERAGADVTGLDRRSSAGGATNLRVDLGAPDLDRAARGALEAADVVFHLAGADRSEPNPGRRSVGRDDAGAAATVLAATPRDVPLVVVTSDDVYGGACSEGGRLRPSHEHDPCLPRDAAARSKVLVERLCERRRATGGLVTVVRPFTVLGPGSGGPRLIDEWVWAARHGLPLQVVGSEDRRRDVVDVRQVAPALTAIAQRPTTDVVNLGTGRPVSTGAVLAAVERAVGRSVTVEHVPAPRETPAATCADTSRFADLVGWVPSTDLGELIAARVGTPADLQAQTAGSEIA